MSLKNSKLRDKGNSHPRGGLVPLTLELYGRILPQLRSLLESFLHEFRVGLGEETAAEVTVQRPSHSNVVLRLKQSSFPNLLSMERHYWPAGDRINRSKTVA